MINSISKATMLALITIVACSLACATVRAAAAKPVEPIGALVALDAGDVPNGPLATWENSGTLKGSFRNDGTNPQVKATRNKKTGRP